MFRGSVKHIRRVAAVRQASGLKLSRACFSRDVNQSQGSPLDPLKTHTPGTTPPKQNDTNIHPNKHNEDPFKTTPKSSENPSEKPTATSSTKPEANTEKEGSKQPPPDYDMFKPEMLWDWKHPMTFIMLGLVCVLHYLNDQKQKEKESAEADARKRGIILEPRSWDFVMDHHTDKWNGYSHRISSAGVDAEKLLELIRGLCAENLPAQTALLEKMKIDACTRTNNKDQGWFSFGSKEGEHVILEVRVVYQSYDPVAMKTRLHRIEGIVEGSGAQLVIKQKVPEPEPEPEPQPATM
eukprot:c6619_g1_i1.p1 GENE.c6619_g1_i1~~c6619_g1_i1.p1  ORF type:complete len:295 (-),score=62.65 c6619_g1_i1:52-936(-)